MGSLRRVIGQVDQSQIATQAVSFDKTRYNIQTAVATLPPSAKYVIYATAFGTPPEISLTLAGTTVRMAAGTSKLSWDVQRSRPGSFLWVGTPNANVRWTAVGVKA